MESDLIKHFSTLPTAKLFRALYELREEKPEVAQRVTEGLSNAKRRALSNHILTEMGRKFTANATPAEAQASDELRRETLEAMEDDPRFERAFHAHDKDAFNALKQQASKEELYQRMVDYSQMMMRRLGGRSPGNLAGVVVGPRRGPAGVPRLAHANTIPRNGILKTALIAVLADEMMNKNPPWGGGNPNWANTLAELRGYFGAGFIAAGFPQPAAPTSQQKALIDWYRDVNPHASRRCPTRI